MSDEGGRGRLPPPTPPPPREGGETLKHILPQRQPSLSRLRPPWGPSAARGDPTEKEKGQGVRAVSPSPTPRALASRIADDAEAVVIVSEGGIEAAAGGVAADLDLVAPGAAAGGAARSVSRAARVAGR